MSNELVFRVRLDGAGRMVADFNQVATAGKTAVNAVSGGSPGLRNMADDAAGLRAQFDGAQKGAAGLLDTMKRFAALGGATAAALAIGKEMLDAQVQAQKLQATLEYIAGGSAGATKELEYLRTTAQRLGLSFTSASTAYARFSAATKESGISADTTRATFEGVAKAATTMGLSAEETNGALLALSQIASKGVVSAEELRGQLGERLPGAFSIAAKAMGVTERELGKMLETGEVMASDFLPRFAAALNDKFAQPVNNVSAELNRLQSAWDLFKQAVFSGDGSGLFSWLTTTLNESAAAMRMLGKEAGNTHRLLVAVGGALSGATLGAGVFDLVGRQKRIMESELPTIRQQIGELEARREASVFNRLNLIDEGKLRELKSQAGALRSELDQIAVKIGKQTGFKDPDLKGQFEAQKAAGAQRLKAYLDDTANESNAVKIAKDIEAENKAFKAATVGLSEASQEYQNALVAHQRRVAEIQAKGETKVRAGRAIDPEKERAAQQREIERQLNEELRALEAENRKLRSQERAAAVMSRTVGNLEDAYGRQRAIYAEEDMSAPQRALAEALRRVAEQADAAREALAAKAATLESDDVIALDAYRAAMERVSVAEQEQIALVRDHEAQQERLNAQWETGAQRALTRYLDSSRSIAEQTEEAFTRAFQGMEDALMNFLTTGKLSFKDFATALIADMARIELRALLAEQAGGGGFAGIVKSLLSMLGLGSGPSFGTTGTTNSFMTNGVALRSAMGNAFGPSGLLHAFAAGGIVDRPTLFRFANGGASARGLMGEAGPEAILPLTRDSAGRLGVRAAGGSGSSAAGGDTYHIHLHGIAGNADDLRRSAGQIGRQVSGAITGARRYG